MINIMVDKKAWKEFRESGLLWWINMILHTFGWAIVIDIGEDGEVTDAYPARVKYRGFGEKYNTIGYRQVSEYLNNNSEALLAESKS